MRKLLAAVAAMLLVAAPATAAPKRKLGAAATPVRLVPLGGGTIAVSGLHSYFGTLELRAAADGIVVVDRLPLERYLLGLNEVPTDWPTEALRAQAVAARTYALYTLAQPRGGAAATYGFDICASVLCQVFAGADVVQGSTTGARWARAVADTAGRAIVYDGEPILARYHSTSGGMTLGNSQAFPTEPDYPYLQSVESRTEGGSPLYRWRVEFKLGELGEMLRRGGLLDASAGALRSVATTASSQGLHYPDVIVRTGASTFRATAQEFREVVGEVAPAMFPGRYPSLWGTSSGRLPETMPSNRVQVTTRGRTVVVVGRGWGHGTGMSQWGAHGLAESGMDHEAILTHYYTGARVTDVANPGEIQVGVTWGESSVSVSGAFAIVDSDGRVLVPEALGAWRFGWDGVGAVAIDPPEGFGLPLRVGLVRAPRRAEPGERVRITVALSRPARVRVVERRGVSGDETIQAAGRRTVNWKAPREPGLYHVAVVASAGGRSLRTEPIEIRVSPPPSPPPIAAPENERGGLSGWLVLAALGLLGAAIIVTATVTIRR